MRNDKGIVLPFPRREAEVSFDELGNGMLGFQINIEDIEYVTVSDAAKMLDITKAKMKELVDSQKIEKRCATDSGYLLLKSDIEELKL